MTVVILTAALALAGASGNAASPFNGVWVDDLKSQMGETGFDIYLIAKGIYKCYSCSPPRSYPADGKTRPVQGDTSVKESVNISGSRAITLRTTSPNMTRETTMTVAADDRSATYVSLDKWPGLAKRLRTEYIAKRVASSPPGAHPASGSWLGVTYIKVPEEYRSVSLMEADGHFARSNFRHGHYIADIDGPAVPVTGDGRDAYQAEVRAPNLRTRVETVLLNGKPVIVRTYTLSQDNRSLTTEVREPGTRNVFSTISHQK